MKRLFFVFLFALTALVFAGCSSSGDSKGGGNGGGSGQSPKDFSGKVIIPSDYAAGYTIQVCADANNSNRCDGKETPVAVGSDGSFSISALPTNPLVAEFYNSSSTSSLGITVSAAGTLPVLIYTTPSVGDIPAETVTVSAFTTLAKNKVDSNYGLYNAISAANEVESVIGFDPFDSAEYTANAVLHEKVSRVAAGILEYIYNTLDVTSENFSAGVISALYNVVSGIVATVVSSPDSAVVYDLVNTNKTEVTKEKIEDATASAPKDWDCTQSLELYMFSLVKNSGGIEVYAVKTGTELQIFGDESYSLPSSKLPSHSGKPFKASYSLTKAIKAAPKKISMIDRFGKSFDLPEGSMVYAMWFRIDYSKLNDISYLREHGNNDGEFGGYTVTRITTTDNSVIDIDDIGQSELSLKSNYNDVITLNVDGTFEWESPDFEVNPFYFTPPFHKTGKFTKLGDEYGALKLTATDGSVAFIYKKSSNGPEWYIAIYPVVEQSVTFFNRVAAEKIISW